MLYNIIIDNVDPYNGVDELVANRFAEMRKLLDSSNPKDKLEAMKRLIAVSLFIFSYPLLITSRGGWEAYW
jgi:hypothetical protein